MQFFSSARPIWAKNLEREMATTLGFYYNCNKSYENELVLKVAASDKYRLYINGEFYYQGPARTAHGYYRVDELKLKANGNLHIAIETVNYYINSFSDLRQPGFIQIELLNGDKVIAATGEKSADDFTSFILTERIRKMPRYSYQRPLCEGYKLTSDYGDWRVGKTSPNALAIETVNTEDKTLLPREIAYETLPVVNAVKVLAYGTEKLDAIPEEYHRDRALTLIGDPEEGLPAGFKEEELEWPINFELQNFKIEKFENSNEAYSGKTDLKVGEFQILSLKNESTGYISAKITCEQDSALYIIFDEKLRNGDVEAPNAECTNALKLELSKGEYNFQSIEPYGFKFVKLLCVSGAVTVNDFAVVEVVCPYDIIRKYNPDNKDLKKIYDAAIQSFRQNAVDIFMDCPTRERAGWLCDSFFTGRSELALTGQNTIEKEFLRNILLAEGLNLPKGMIAMCYPSDIIRGSFLPNWALWFILELEDFCKRNNDTEFIKQFRDKAYGILGWFAQYENSDGLLERLPGWIFVEWSRSNDLVQHINFPTNMVYARAMKAAAFLFGDDSLKIKSDKLYSVIRERSYNGEFFVDNEVYKDDVPVSSGESTETCQYYAFFTGTATPESYPELWNKMMNNFGPKREETKLYPEVASSNMFIGYYLRLELLRRSKQFEKIKEECIGYFLSMAEITGTLWENKTDWASCNHGFTSYAAVLLLEAESGKLFDF